jgi:hypothetical protein
MIGKFLTPKQQVTAMAIGIAVATVVIYLARGSIFP